nr:MAG TPA: hypothetical protein [Caudoviricetes sp.]DAZ10772.1 MAG TPA: hypothetical protein [Caudoviricetes sp.]
MVNTILSGVHKCSPYPSPFRRKNNQKVNR